MHVLSVPSDLLAPSVASALPDALMLSALVADIGFQPKTPIEEGIRRFVVWYKEYYGIG